ncbi:hypothetical protein D3Z89_20740 [Bacillus subtilis]|nr:hypothetical protein C7T97_16130 [Bacillus subtilis]RMD52813.1 hypothetical protein D3Z89_20740 [Bacillus subtilis]
MNTSIGSISIIISLYFDMSIRFLKLKTAYQFCSPLKFIIKLYEIGLIIVSLNTWGNPAGDKDFFKYCSSD